MSWACGRNLKIAFVGTGAQGASIGADFTLAGLDITFIERWPEHVEAMKARGVTANMLRFSSRVEVSDNININGHVVATLKSIGQSAPVNERIVEIARSMERGERVAQPSNTTLFAA